MSNLTTENTISTSTENENLKYTAKEYIENRLASQRSYFSKSSAKNKKNYYRCSTIKLIFSLLITAIAPLSDYNSCSYGVYIVSFMAAVVAISEGISLLYNYYENWVNYRTSNERLKREEMLYRTGAGKYYGKNEDVAFDMFVQNIEGIVDDSTSIWRNTNQNQNQSQ